MNRNDLVGHPRREFRECFNRTLDMPVRWFGNRECVWVDKRQQMHGLYLFHYGGSLCPPVWRAQVNHITPAPVLRMQKSVKIGNTVRHLSPYSPWSEQDDPLLISHETARDAFSFELSFHLDELETIAGWLGELLTAQENGSALLPEPPVDFGMPRNEVLDRIFTHGGYLWTVKGETDYDIAYRQREERKALRAKRNEEYRMQLAQTKGVSA